MISFDDVLHHRSDVSGRLACFLCIRKINLLIKV